MEAGLQLSKDVLVESEADLHFPSGYFVAFLEELNAIKSLLLCWLIQLQWKVHLLDGLLDVFRREAALRDRVHAFLNNDLDDVSQNAALLGFSFFVAYLQLSAFENDLDDFPLCLACEELVEVCFFGKNAMRGVFVDLLNLEDFR